VASLLNVDDAMGALVLGARGSKPSRNRPPALGTGIHIRASLGPYVLPFLSFAQTYARPVLCSLTQGMRH